ncbi:uncharacterized transporter R00093-like [Symsagittifera roscoffensis]|uniref:uncharacterized transporter R00093-like n=1 Tax=Symsagittifera roscoffensis TaxID=84072 RepID=UPI00307B711A
MDPSGAMNYNQGDVTLSAPGLHQTKVYHIWAMGVGAVIAGDFFGWQSSLVGGFLGACISLGLVTVLYLLLSLCIAELASFKPDAGGPYTYVSALLGPNLGFLSGLCEALKVITVGGVGIYAIGSYMVQITDTDPSWQPLWWLAFVLFFTLVNVVGLKFSFHVELAITLISVTVLVVFYLGAIPKFNFDKWVLGNCDSDDLSGNSSACPQRWLYPNGLDGLSAGVSFALWFYLGIEEIPMVVGEGSDDSKKVVVGILSAMATLTVLSGCTLLFSCAIEPGAYAISTDNSPLLTGYRTIVNHGNWFEYFSWVIVVGFVASCMSFLLCAGRLLFAMSRDGLLPAPLSRLLPKADTPYIALITSSVLSYAITALLYCITGGDDQVGSALINMALFGALVSYFLQCASHIKLVMKYPNRTCYKSPFGIPGTVVCLFLCLLSYACIIKEGLKSLIFLYSLIGAILCVLLGMAYHFVKLNVQKRRVENYDSLN